MNKIDWSAITVGKISANSIRLCPKCGAFVGKEKNCVMCGWKFIEKDK